MTEASRPSIPRGPLVIDVAGTLMTPAEEARLLHPLVGGVILFARNFTSRKQLVALTKRIHDLRTPRLLIAVDHEGGRVQRFRTDGFTTIPSMRSLGIEWLKDPMHAMRMSTDVGYVLGAELRACGVDLSFTPVLDLDFGVSSVIGDRAFDGDPRVVAMLARALSQGLSQAGMSACGKHFPGHGAVAADSHHAVPRDARSLKKILEHDAAPYQWLGDKVIPSVMPAHVIYTKVDPKPAGFSERWIKEILRKKLSYDGVVFSDDLTMEGAAVAGDILARARAALNAGCDMALVCNRPDLADDLLSRLTWQSTRHSLERIERLMPKSDALDWRALQKQLAYLEALKSVQALHERV